MASTIPVDPLYTPAQRRALLRALREGRSDPYPDCPACGGPLTRRDLPPRRDVPYVRDRVCYMCASCGRAAVIDRREIARPPT